MANNSDNIIQRVENRTKDFVKEQVERSVSEALPKTSSLTPRMSSSLEEAMKPLLAEIKGEIKKSNVGVLVDAEPDAKAHVILEGHSSKLENIVPAIKATLALMQKEGASQGEHVENSAAPSSVCSVDSLLPLPAKGR